MAVLATAKNNSFVIAASKSKEFVEKKNTLKQQEKIKNIAIKFQNNNLNKKS